jgi:hypothetical protein
MTTAPFELDQFAHKAILLYNRLRSPEVTVKLVLVTSVSITVAFSGGFCYSCGVMDYVDSFAQQFRTLSGKYELKLIKTKEINPRSFEANYLVKLR